MCLSEIEMCVLCLGHILEHFFVFCRRRRRRRLAGPPVRRRPLYPSLTRAMSAWWAQPSWRGFARARRSDSCACVRAAGGLLEFLASVFPLCVMDCIVLSDQDPSFGFCGVFLLCNDHDRDFFVLAAAAVPAAPAAASHTHTCLRRPASKPGRVDRFNWAALLPVLVLTKRVRVTIICIFGRAWFNPVL